MRTEQNTIEMNETKQEQILLITGETETRQAKLKQKQLKMKKMQRSSGICKQTK